MSKKCYVVQGYREYETETICVFMDEKLAQESAEKAASNTYDAVEVVTVDFEGRSQFEKLGDR